MFSKVVFTMIFFLLAGKTALADHQHRGPTTIQMKTQHHTMAVIDEEWIAAKNAIRSGDLSSAAKAVQTILAKSAYIEKFQGYNNADKRAEFLSEYNLFVERVKRLSDKINTKDNAAVNKAMQEVQNSCKRCHAMFE